MVVATLTTVSFGQICLQLRTEEVSSLIANQNYMSKYIEILVLLKILLLSLVKKVLGFRAQDGGGLVGIRLLRIW